ncbi:MAG: methyltransferase domain-containing protein [Sphingobacteriales bacterium]|uniref:class I SAM-dependent methyltransferase n=1 Tax=Hydrotalea flava TaxID=714549 RepID=UPI00082B8177|nr:class I SAM-dependent methyltransferase [Hydrotalea flava]RTL49084.1 MAG: methyltransferase domain-containing protein [Sphingobacteriales bacterium]
MLIYRALNTHVLNEVKEDAMRILDVGCGSGNLGAALKIQMPSRKIYGITYFESERLEASSRLDKVWVCDLNTTLPDLEGTFDCIIFSHILEHTMHPENVLLHFKQYLQKEGIVIIALPNVLFFKQRLEFFKGNFRYSNIGGLMDNTHYTFFDWNTAADLLLNTGLTIKKRYADGHFPLPLFRKILPGLSKKIDQFFLKLYPGLFGFQFILVGGF